MLINTGIPSKTEILSKFPERTLLIKPKAVIECYQDIPCNPCETSCPFDAITIGSNINQQPKLNPIKCIGCGVCIYSCPGLAIHVVQEKSDAILFKIPYEFYPLPKVGEKWRGVSRDGIDLCEVEIIQVQQSIKQDKTAIITVQVPTPFLYDFITIRSCHE